MAGAKSGTTFPPLGQIVPHKSIPLLSFLSLSLSLSLSLTVILRRAKVTSQAHSNIFPERRMMREGGERIPLFFPHTSFLTHRFFLFSPLETWLETFVKDFEIYGRMAPVLYPGAISSGIRGWLGAKFAENARSSVHR